MEEDAAVPLAPPGVAPAWLVLLYQVPSRSSSIRVRIWRRLQGVGAVQIRQAAWVLPNRDRAREDIEWLKAEIVGLGGQATVLLSDTIDAFAYDEIVDAFRAARARDIATLSKRGRRLIAQTARKGHARSLARLARAARALIDEWRALAATLFFDTPGTAEMEDIVNQLVQVGKTPSRSTATGSPLSPAAYRKRRWVTRPRPGVDRMACAWLIRTFIDPQAQFEFHDDVPAGAVPFDMFGVEFGHHGNACTFEVLRERFGLVDDPAVEWIAKVVHDLDLRERQYNEPEAPGIELMVEGLRRAHTDDAELLDRGIALFSSLAKGVSGRSWGGSATSPRGRRPRQPRAGSSTAVPVHKARR